ncbi:hypothetical protein GRX01_01970 [Halobaculum sp. WSA2]|uniref:Halobacterial output domain-containing protein n=1 Tax=Halobaculum saliterrae TaxID=2073113 RepID=A0A6B0SRE2_9EURY|nr:HalOD1 output domain-containing protein [Halobaculum saliterrae]MXR40126.1 hypothetical protein [Halobaculum saliterrae]
MSEAVWCGDTEPCVEIVSAVSEATGLPSTRLPPLQRSVDVDALEALVSGDASSSLRIEFEYAGVVVSVGRDGVIALDSVDE